MTRYVAFLVLAFIAGHSLVVADELVYPCTSPADCEPIQDSICSLDACVCPGGRIMNSDMTKCLTVSGGYGSKCEETVQCTVRMLTGSTCYYDSFLETSSCMCATGYHYLHGRCWESVGLNGACTTSDQCFGNGNYDSLSCNTSGVCVCSEGFYLHADQTYCRRAGTEPGDQCYFDFDCKFDGGFCNLAQQCESSTRDFPLLHHRYTEDGSSPASRGVGKEGWSPLDAYIPNKNCTNNAECTDTYPNSECTQGSKCWCLKGFYYYGGKCAKELGELCTANTDCNHITNGTCIILDTATEGSCTCNAFSTAAPNNQKCSRLRPGIGYNCQTQTECQNFGPECQCVPVGDFVKCECSSKSHFEPDTQTCWLNKGYGDSCLDDRDCLTASGQEGINCIDGTCQCVEGFHETAQDCRPDGLVYGDTCIDSVDCFFNFASCVDSACECSTGYYALNNTNGVVECITGIGGACNATADPADCAHVAGAVCDADTSSCVCDSSQGDVLTPSTLNDKCLKVATSYEDACVEDAQCQTMFGADILCTDEKCVCRADFHFRDEACWPITLLNEKCNLTSQCYVPSDSERAQCRNGFCECGYEYPTAAGNTDCTSAGDAIHPKIGVFTALLLVTYLLITSTFSRP